MQTTKKGKNVNAGWPGVAPEVLRCKRERVVATNHNQIAQGSAGPASVFAVSALSAGFRRGKAITSRIDVAPGMYRHRVRWHENEEGGGGVGSTIQMRDEGVLRGFKTDQSIMFQIEHPGPRADRTCFHPLEKGTFFLRNKATFSHLDSMPEQRGGKNSCKKKQPAVDEHNEWYRSRGKSLACGT